MRSLLVALPLLSLPACSPPGQAGLIEVRPGAEDRFELALRMGYLGSFDRELVPAQVRLAGSEDQLPRGAGRAGRVGDWVLENGHVVAVVSAADGTARGGRLLDLAEKPNQPDTLQIEPLRVLGKIAIYDQVKSGWDEPTRAAWVEGSGRVDLRADGGPLLTVSTRFDVGPGVRGVIVHTHVKLEEGSMAASEALPLLEERVGVTGARDGLLLPEGGAASLGRDGGVLVRSLGVEASLASEDGWVVYRVPVTATPGLGAASVFSRMVSPLERADSASVAVAYARASGEPVGSVEVRVISRGKGAIFGDISFVPEHGDPLDVCGVWAHGGDSHFEATLPGGTYDVVFRGAGLRGRGGRIEVKGDRLAWIDLPARPESPAESSPLEPLSSAVRPPFGSCHRAAHDPSR